MTQASVYQPRTASPTSFGLVVLIHGAAIAALLLARMEMPQKPGFTQTTVKLIPTKKPPPDVVPPKPEARVLPPQPVYVDREILIPPPPHDDSVATARREPVYSDPGPIASKTIDLPPVTREVPKPVRRDARLDPSSELKPPYPISEQRAGTEGTVTLRVLIGPDGKVRGAEKVSATNDAFFQATLRHALRHWRFRPATIDGRPIETSKVMTLHFTLEEDG
jgi:protein TonB